MMLLRSQIIYILMLSVLSGLRVTRRLFVVVVLVTLKPDSMLNVEPS